MTPDHAPPTAEQLVLLAQQRNIEAIEHLTRQIDLVDVAGQLIYLLQRERGISSIFLGSQGRLYAGIRHEVMRETQPIEALLGQAFARQMAPELGLSGRMLALMAWIRLDLDALPTLRVRIEQQTLDAHTSLATFSRLIASLMELIAQVADASVHPDLSSLLLACLYLLQSIETAGQERALGALMFACARNDDSDRQRILNLIDAQEHSLKLFNQFVDPVRLVPWQQHQLTPSAAQLERLRRILCTARADALLDAAQADAWFESASERIDQLWWVEKQLISDLRDACTTQARAARQEWRDTEGLLHKLRTHPPVHAHAVECFFDPQGAPGAVPVLATAHDRSPASTESDAAVVSALHALLADQAGRLSRMEAELTAARRALHDRKVIDRAKALLMRKLGLPEDVAFRMLQKTAMDQNRRLGEVAEALLALPDLALDGLLPSPTATRNR
jgi:hypothetical protein